MNACYGLHFGTPVIKLQNCKRNKYVRGYSLPTTNHVTLRIASHEIALNFNAAFYDVPYMLNFSRILWNCSHFYFYELKIKGNFFVLTWLIKINNPILLRNPVEVMITDCSTQYWNKNSTVRNFIYPSELKIFGTLLSAMMTEWLVNLIMDPGSCSPIQISLFLRCRSEFHSKQPWPYILRKSPWGNVCPLSQHESRRHWHSAPRFRAAQLDTT
jgi:hypothetical protein